jgi:hypothetical protein
MVMPRSDKPPGNSGSPQIDFRTLHGNLKDGAYRYSLEYTGDSKNARVKSLRFKLISGDDEAASSGLALHDFIRSASEFLAQVEAELRASTRRVTIDLEWLANQPDFDERVKLLRQNNQSKVLKESESGAAHSHDEPLAAMGSGRNSHELRAVEPQLSDRESRDMTMITVAQLYALALMRFPNRDRSVVRFIQEHLEWLSDLEITAYVQRARLRGIDLPVYRRGRIPKKRKQ